MARALLREALGRLQSGKPVDADFSEDAMRRVRTDEMEARSPVREGRFGV